MKLFAQCTGIWNTIFLAFKAFRPKQRAGPFSDVKIASYWPTNSWTVLLQKENTKMFCYSNWKKTENVWLYGEIRKEIGALGKEKAEK